MFSHRNLSLYGGHEDEINCLIFSSDFEILLTGSNSGFIRIWNTVDDHLTLKIQERTGRIRGLAITNNDKCFASISNNIDVRLYETRTGTLVHLLSGHTYASDCIQFSSDNRFLATGAWDCRTIVWNVITGEQIYNFHHHTDAVQSIAFHSNRNIMVTGSYDHTIFLYNLDEVCPSKPLALYGHGNNIRALAFSSLPYLASAGYDKIIIIWQIGFTDSSACENVVRGSVGAEMSCHGQIKNLRVYSRLFGHTGWIQAVSFHLDNGSVLASVDDDTVYVWNIITGVCLHQLSIINDLSCYVRFLPNEKGLIVGGAVYELLLDQTISSVERIRTRRTHESITTDSTREKNRKSLLF